MKYIIDIDLFNLDHILPLAIGHTIGNEDYESWDYFLSHIPDQLAPEKKFLLALDRSKGGEKATMYVKKINTDFENVNQMNFFS
jgi:uncharacterized SAM-dependent methyltransferase